MRHKLIAALVLTLLLGLCAAPGAAQGGQSITGFYTSAGDNLTPEQAVLTELFAPDDDLNILVLFDDQHSATFEVTYTVTDPSGERYVSDLDIPSTTRWAILGFDWERRDGAPWPVGNYTGVLAAEDGTSYTVNFRVDDRLRDVDSLVPPVDDKAQSYYNIWRLEHVIFGARGEHEFVLQIPFSWRLADILDTEWVSAAQTLTADSSYNPSYIASSAEAWDDLAVLTSSVQPQDEDGSLAFRPQPWWIETNISNQEDLDTLPFMSLNNYITGDFPCTLVEEVTAQDAADGLNVQVVYWGDGPYDCGQREDTVRDFDTVSIHATYLFLPDPRGTAGYMWYVGVHDDSYPLVEADIARIFSSVRVLPANVADTPTDGGSDGK
ncbi:MAG: hypothetical protein JW910_22495 [Anaerolineae bacterium]|nr:hypothetical protein [Anaerolineae bacterium]